MQISNDTFLRIKSTLSYRAIPYKMPDGRLLAGFEHELPADSHMGAVSNVEAGQWLKADIEKVEASVAEEMETNGIEVYNMNTEVLKRFGL